MLNFNGAWRFESPGGISDGVILDFSDLIGKITTQGDVQRTLEHFKSYFAGAAGTTSGWSSDASWAQTDLHRYMNEAAANAPLFIEAFYDGCETLREKGIAVPDVRLINKILAKHNTGFEIRPPDLISNAGDIAPVEVPAAPPSLDDQAKGTIQKSLADAAQLLSEGRDRQAVQELLWLLETVSTAFQGLDTGNGTIEGKYFNKIVADLRRHNQGTTLDQVLIWVTALHGYLSSPTGGGIRHGAHLKEGIVTKPDEARLFCNLIRSYISFLLTEHERLTRH
jgi:hypothetical protein